MDHKDGNNEKNIPICDSKFKPDKLLEKDGRR
jgi:hypothetical protein